MKKRILLTLNLLCFFTLAQLPTSAQYYVHTRDISPPYSGITSIVFTSNEKFFVGNLQAELEAVSPNSSLRNFSRKWLRDVGDPVYAMAIPSHNPSFIAYGGRGNSSIRMRYTSNGNWRGEARAAGIIRDLAFKPNSYLLASASEDNTIRIWNLESPNPVRLRTLRGHTDDVISVAWSPDGGTLASGSHDGTVRLWNPNNGINFATLQGHRDSIRSVEFSPSGDILATAEKNAVRIWDIDTERTLRVLKTWGYGIAFHPDGSRLASVSHVGHTDIFNPTTGQHIARIRSTRGGGWPGGRVAARVGVAWHPDGKALLVPSFSGSRRFGLIESLPLDVTGNGSLTVWDIREVAHPNNYDKPTDEAANSKADVNGDDTVDITDLILVAKGLQAINAAKAAAGAPPLAQHYNQNEIPSDENTSGIPFTATDVQQWLAAAKSHDVDASGIAALESLLALLVQPEIVAPPKQTVLFANYPNPFNPETWIPYQLAQAAEVSVEIHAADGTLVRSLALGQLPAGVYQSKQRAAYWDGQNKQGEPVASGLYFYTLKAGEFSATRKMLIQK